MDGGNLYYAVVENDTARLTQLLEQGGNVDEFYEDTMNISSKSLLHVCCGKGHVECLKVLIEYGAQLDVRDKWGQTPLMYSIIIQFPEVAKVLLDVDRELVKSQDRYGKAPLHCAVEANSEELVQLLLEYGADVNIRCHDGMTPLMMCCTSDPEGQKQESMRVLLEAEAIVDLKDYKGKRTALHVASAAGNFQAVERLLAAGADINDIDKTQRTPLTSAIFAGVRGPEVKGEFMKIISLLVTGGADLNVNVSESCNPLMSAAFMKSETMVGYFLSLGADPDVTFPSGVTPALVAASTGDLNSLKTLLFHNCSLTLRGKVYKRRKKLEFVLDPFELAYMEGYLDLCTVMADAGYNLHGKRGMFVVDLQGPLGRTLQEGELTAPSLSLASPEHVPADYLATLAMFIQRSHNPRSLTELAIFVIRTCCGKHLINGVDLLPLPTPIKKSILLTHLLK